MSDNSKCEIAWACVIALAVLVVGGVALLVGVTTHASHIKLLDNQNQQMIACVQSDRTAADCRVLVMGSR